MLHVLLAHLNLWVYGEHQMADNVCQGKSAEMLLNAYNLQLKYLLSVKRASNQACGDAVNSDLTI